MNIQSTNQLLPIPVTVGVALIPFPMTEEDFDMMIATLNLWKKRLTHEKNKASNQPEGNIPISNREITREITDTEIHG